ncbi:Fibronectin type III domain protein [Aciduliprofundum boonei T469]|nr:Fibronectin type III domain protein [Aciduliprofundum boonei T469]
MKLDSNGQILGAKRYETSEEEQIGDVAVINDAAVILGSSLREERASLGNVTYVHNVSNLLLFKIDGGGKIQWQRLYYLGESFYGVAVSKANKGYYFAANGKDFLPEFGRWHVPVIFKVNKYGGIGFPRNSSMEMREINLENSDIDVSMKKGSYSSGLQMLKVRNISLKAKSANISDVYLSDGYSPPLQPTNLSASIKEGKIYLSWKGPVDNGGLNITSYRIYRSEDGKEFEKIAETKNTTYVDTLEKGGKYEYYVTAVNSVGESEKSDIVEVCIPGEEIIPWGYIAIAAGIVGIVAIFLLLKKMKNKRR